MSNKTTIISVLNNYNELRKEILELIRTDSYMFFGAPNPEIISIDYFNKGTFDLTVRYLINKKGISPVGVSKYRLNDLKKGEASRRAEKLKRIQKHSTGENYKFLNTVQPTPFYNSISRAMGTVFEMNQNLRPSNFETGKNTTYDFRLVKLREDQATYHGNVFDIRAGEQVLDCLYTSFSQYDFAHRDPVQVRVYLPIYLLKMTPSAMEKEIKMLLDENDLDF